MKKVLCMYLCLCALLIAGFALSKDLSPDLNVYSMLAVVTELDPVEDLVSVSNCNGSVFQFYGVEDWDIGDFVNLTLHDNFTEDSIYDDIILSARYERIDLVNKIRGGF